MQLVVKIGKRGVVVIPANVRRKFGLRPGALLRLTIGKSKFEFQKDASAVDRIREIAKTTRVKRKIIYGDALYGL